MKRRLLAALLCAGSLSAQNPDPKLFLTPQRLHRLKRDRERQTQRWADFEAQVKAGGSSAERPCELAVYYAVTGQGDPGSPDHCPATFSVPSAEQVGRFLLDLKPAAVEHPTWQQHLQALALVNMQPNSGAAQFLQGWAIEDRFEIHSGPGMVYELLWANPYLPGVGFRNMDPWFYDGHGTLIARSNWDASACWVRVSMNGVEQENCPAGWQEQPVVFGTLELIPAVDRCVQFERRRRNEEFVIWKLKPAQKLNATDANGRKQEYHADEGGLWRVPVDVDKKVCVGR